MASRTYNYCFNPDDDDVECFLIQIDCMIKSLSIEDEDGKKRALIESLSTKALKQLLMHLHPVKWDAESTTLDILKEGLRKMYTPQVNKWVAREYFNHRVQREEETVEDYAVALKDMANYCDFGTDYESRIMEKLSVGLRNAANKQAMFSFYGESVPNIDISLEKAIEKAIAIDSATNISYMFNHQGYDGYDTGAVGIHSWSAVGPKAPSNWKCWRCGECDHAAESCWARTQICPICREYGHIPQMCSALQRSHEQGRREYSDDGQPMEKILDYIKISQRGRGGGRGGPFPSSEHIDESILQFLQSPMQNQRQFQGRGRLPSLPHVQNANDMGYDNMRGPVGRGSMPHPAFGDGKQRYIPQNAPDFDESDIEYDQNHLSPTRGGIPFRGRGGSRFSPARVEEVQTEYLQATHPAGRSGRLQGNNQLSAGGGGGPVRGSISQAQPSSVNSSHAAAISASQNAASTNQGHNAASANQGPHSASANQGPIAASASQGPHAASANQGPHAASANQGPHAASANQGPHAASANQGPHAASANQGPHAASANQGPHAASANQGPHVATANQGPQATNSSSSLNQAQLAESISRSLNQAPPQFSDKSSKQFTSQEPEVHHTIPKQNKQMNNLLGELQNKHKDWRGSKSLSPSDYGDEVYEKDKFRSLPGRGKDNHRHSWGGSGLPKSGSMTSEGETDESIDQMYASLGHVDGRTNIVALDLHSPATAAVPTDAKVPNKKALSTSTSRVKPFKLPSSAFAPFESIIPPPPTPPPRVRGNKHTKKFKGDKDSIVKACSKEESEFVEDKEQSKEDSKSVENNKNSKEDSEPIDHKKTSKEDSEKQSKSIENNEVKMTAVTNSEEKKPSPKARPEQPPLPARAPRITVPDMKSPEPDSEIPPCSPSTPPPPPPPPPSDYDCIASPAPPDLPPPPENCRSNSPPPPPPPPSYHPSEVSGDELPPPPVPTHQQEATLEFPPPPPSIADSKKDHTKASDTSLPTPPTPPPRHSRNGTKTEKNYCLFIENEEEFIDKPDLPPPPARVLRGIDAFFPDDAICNQVIQETDEEYEEEFLTDITDTDDEVFHEALDELPLKYRNSNQSDLETSDLCSLDSSSTLTATLLLTQASDISPLPPHALRVSPVPTEEVVNLSSPDCTTVTDDRTITPLSDFTPVSNLFDMSKDSTLDMETPAPTPQLSETPVTTGEYSPDLQKISSPSIEEFDSKAGSDISLPQSPSETLCSETISTLTPDISDVDRRSPSLTSTNNTRAQMSSPMSIDTPTLFSLPTDTSRISVDFDYLVDDTLTIDTSTFNTSSQNHFLASCSEFSDSTSRRSVDSALGSAPLSPAYTGSCTITPMPTDNTLTPMSTNPTTTPIPSPIPRELLYPTPPSSLPSEAFISPWQSFSNSTSIDTSSIQEDLTPDFNIETANVLNVIQTNQIDEKSSNIISITETSVTKIDVKDINSSDHISITSLTEEVMQKESCSEEVKDVTKMDVKDINSSDHNSITSLTEEVIQKESCSEEKDVKDRDHLNDQGNEKHKISTSSLASSTKSFDAEASNGETDQIEKILKDVIETGSELTTSLSEVKNKEKDNDINKLEMQEDMRTYENTSDNQAPSAVESSPPITSPSLALLSITSPETKPSLKFKTRSSLTSTSSVESTSSLTSISSLSNESNTVSSMDSMKLQRKEKAKPDVILKELGERNSLTDQIVRELGERQKSQDRSHAQDTLNKSSKPPLPESIPSTPFTVSTPPGSPATLRRRGRPNYLPRGSPEPYLEILSIPDPPTPPPRRNKLGSTKSTSEASKCDLSIASTSKVGGFVPRPPQRSNTLPIIPLNRNSMSGKLPTSSPISPLPSTLPMPIPGKHNRSPRSPIPAPSKPEKSLLSSSPSLRSLINKGGARMKSLSPLRNAKNKSPARSSSPIRWVHSPIPSSPQSPIVASPKSPEQAITYLDNIMDSLDALTSNLPNSPPPESAISGQFFFPQAPVSSYKVIQDSSEDVEIPWRKKRIESGVDTNTDKSNKTSVPKQDRPNSECLENLVNHILNDVDTNLEMKKTEVSSYQGHTESKQTESLKTKSVEERNESFVKEYEQKVNFTYSNKNDISFAAQSQQEKLDQIRQKKDSEVKEEFRRTENSCDSTHKETRVTFTSNSQESRYDLQSGINHPVTPQSVPLSELLSEPLEPSRVKNDIKSHENIPVSQKSTSVSHRNVIETHESNVQVSQCDSNVLTENTSSSMTNTSVHSENISSPENAASMASGSTSGSIRVTSGNGIASPEIGSASVKKNPVLLENVTISQTNAQDSSMNISYESSFKSTFIAAKNCESETNCSPSESSATSHSLNNNNNLTTSSSFSSPSSTLSSSSSTSSSSSSSNKTSEYHVSSLPHELNQVGMYEVYVTGEGEGIDLFDKPDMLSPDEEKCVADDLDEEHQTSFNFLEHSASQTFKPYPLEHTESHSSISTILTASSCLSDSTLITVIQNTSDTDNDSTRDKPTANKIVDDNLNFESFENNDNNNTVSVLTNVINESDRICDAKDTFDTNIDSDYMSFNNNNADIFSVSTNSLSVPNDKNESNPVPLSSESNTLSDANINNMGCLESSFLSSPTPCSIHGDATSTPPPVSHHSKTPPLPPPRSTTTTPKPSIGLGHVPAPPVRQYMLIPINHPLAVHSARSTPARQLSPPPAPLRSSSIRKTSPPPPPNRSRSQTPVGWLEWTEQRPPLPPPPPPPISACNSATPTPLLLSPVPEESSSRSPSDHSESPQSPLSADEEFAENTASKQTFEEFSNESSVFCGYVGKVSDIAVSRSSENISSAEPPRIPPPPSDDVDYELPPPPPPPPSDTTPEEEKPLLPPLPSDIASLSIQRIPAPPPRNKIVTPALPPLPNIPLNSSPLSPQLTPPQLPPPPLEDVQSPKNINNFLSAESEPGNSEASVIPSEPPPPTMFQANETANSSMSLLAMNNVCLVPPPPPPPPMPSKGSLRESSSPTPPVLSISPYGKVVVNRTDLPPPSPEEEIRKVFKNAKDWAWLDQLSDTLAVYTQLRPTMQQGPQCGLVALSMASQIFPETLEVDTILNMAKDRGFTAHGEMFSAEKMAQLASEISGVEASVHRDVLSNPKILLQTLLQGDLILVPYDADGNHQPSKRKGHKAHWGVISGALVQCPGLNVTMGGAAKIDTQVDNLYHLRPKNRAGLPGSARRGGGGTTPVNNVSPRFSASPMDARFSASPLDVWGTPDVELWKMCNNSRVSTPQLQSLPNDDFSIVLLWRQGKSRNLIASTLDALCESNDQLEEYTPPANEREHDALEFLEPGSCCVITIQEQLP